MTKILFNKTGEIIEAENKEEAKIMIMMFVKFNNARHGGTVGYKRDNKNNYTIIEE